MLSLTTLSEDDKLTLYQAAHRKFFNEHLFFMARDLLGYRDISHVTHDKMIWCLQSEAKRKLIVMPRGTFKSSISSIAYPIFKLNRNPNERILLDSELYSNSKNLLREIRQHLRSERLTKLYGQYESSTWNEGEIIIRQRTKVMKEASITCGGMGTEKTGQHYSLIIADDLNSPNNSHTQEGRQKVIDHYRYYTSILEPDGELVVVGTRYASNDVIGVIIENEIRRHS